MDNPTRAVNLRHEPYDVYIGRAGHGQGGYFGNPFPLPRRAARPSLQARSWRCRCDQHHPLTRPASRTGSTVCRFSLSLSASTWYVCAMPHTPLARIPQGHKHGHLPLAGSCSALFSTVSGSAQAPQRLQIPHPQYPQRCAGCSATTAASQTQHWLYRGPSNGGYQHGDPG